VSDELDASAALPVDEDEWTTASLHVWGKRVRFPAENCELYI